MARRSHGFSALSSVSNTVNGRRECMIGVGERELLVQAIEQQLGRSLSSQVREAFLRVPRHMFVEQYYEQRGNSLSWNLVQAPLEKIYRDEALVTQIDERGMPS